MFAGLSLARPLVMGIINVTPDSFSDGGDFNDPQAAITHGLRLMEAGADILDVGGESTRPGAKSVSIADEIARVVPVIEALAAAGARVSIDTRHAAVMEAAVAAGAAIINDVQALEGDGALAVAARTGADVILMHMQGEPGTMQQNPTYDCASRDVAAYLGARVRACEGAGIPRQKIAVDPGIGFGKGVDHNLDLLAHMGPLLALGCPVVLGTSRKSFIGQIAGADHARDRLGGSLASVLAGVLRGAHIVRVHDVFETVQALKVWRAIEDAD